MNKFKKILLGTLSVLTLGLFVATGAKVNAEIINVESGSTSAISGNTYVLNAKTILENEGKSAENDSTNVSAANLSSGKLNYGIFAFNSGKSWGFRREDSAYSAYDKYGIFSNGSSRTITVALSEGQKIDVTLVAFVTATGSNVTSTTNNSSWINTNTFSTVYTELNTFTDSYTAEKAGNYVITFSNKIGFTQLRATISSTQAAEGTFNVSYSNISGATLQSGYKNPTNLSEETSITLPTCTKSGYTFTNWSCSKDSKTYKAGDSYTADEDVTFTANWTANNYTVTYDANGGSVENATKEVTYGSTYTLDTPVRSGHTFTGWKNGNTDVSTSGTWSIANNVTLKASWVEEITGDYSHNFTADGKTNSKIDISGNLATNKGTATYNNTTLTQCLKMESATNISFATSKDMKLVLVFASTETNKKTTIDGNLYTTDSNAQIVIDLEAGSHTITKGGGDSINLFYIDLYEDNIAHSVTATLLKQFDDDDNPTMLRLIGKIDGIAYDDFANISNVLMEFDFNNNHRTSYCYKLYKSVSSASLTEAANTMYVVLTIKGVDGYTNQSMSFTNVKMTITFSDNSTKVANRDNIDIA